MIVKCDNCGKEFNKKKANVEITKHNYCSRKCVIEHRKRKPNICMNCGNYFVGEINSKFCSHSCSASFNNLGKSHLEYKNKKVDGEACCQQCGKKFIIKYGKMFCSAECYNKYQKEDKIRKFLNGELSDNAIRRDVIRNFLISRQDGGCSICKCPPFHNGKPLVFIVDHIDGNFLNNKPENMRAICPNCNSQTDTFCRKNADKFPSKRHKKNYR